MVDMFSEEDVGKQKFTVGIGELVDRFQLEIVYEPENFKFIKIASAEVSRPGLQIATCDYKFFDNTRIQIIGNAEHAYLEGMTPEERLQCARALFSHGIPTVIFTRSHEVFDEFWEMAKEYSTPILRTPDTTSPFMSALIAWLNVALAPRITRHGVLVEVYGEGVLILGESGVGKSETAVELVKRGHRLVADDAVEVKRVSAISVVGSSPDIIRHFIELRGIGIIDVKNIFGMGAVKDSEKIDMIIHIEHWVAGKSYDRLGLENNYTEILGIKIPSITIPVRPGRNLAVIVEVAAMNNRQKRMGYNAAEELTERLSRQMEMQLNEDL